MNRQLARIVGDWSFPPRIKWLAKEVEFKSMQRVKRARFKTRWMAGFLPQKIDQNLKEFSKKFIINTAKIFSLYNLFDKIYDNVKVFEFEQLFNSPKNVFKGMAEEKGFSFTDFSLINARLNSLPNRFLIYNSFILEVDSETQNAGLIWGISEESKFGFKHKSPFRDFSLIGKIHLKDLAELNLKYQK